MTESSTAVGVAGTTSAAAATIDDSCFYHRHTPGVDKCFDCNNVICAPCKEYRVVEWPVNTRDFTGVVITTCRTCNESQSGDAKKIGQRARDHLKPGKPSECLIQ